MIGIMIVLGWLLIGALIYWYLPNAPISSGMSVVGKPVLRWQYALFAMGWLGKLIAFASYFAVGRNLAISVAVAALFMLLLSVVLVAWNWHPKSKSDIIEDLRNKLKELES